MNYSFLFLIRVSSSLTCTSRPWLRDQHLTLRLVLCKMIENRNKIQQRLVPARTACNVFTGHLAVPYLTYSISNMTRRQCCLPPEVIVRRNKSATACLLASTKCPIMSRSGARHRRLDVSSVLCDIILAATALPAAPAHTICISHTTRVYNSWPAGPQILSTDSNII